MKSISDQIIIRQPCPLYIVRRDGGGTASSSRPSSCRPSLSASRWSSRRISWLARRAGTPHIWYVHYLVVNPYLVLFTCTTVTYFEIGAVRYFIMAVSHKFIIICRNCFQTFDSWSTWILIYFASWIRIRVVKFAQYLMNLLVLFPSERTNRLNSVLLQLENYSSSW